MEGDKGLFDMHEPAFPFRCANGIFHSRQCRLYQGIAFEEPFRVPLLPGDLRDERDEEIRSAISRAEITVLQRGSSASPSSDRCMSMELMPRFSQRAMSGNGLPAQQFCVGIPDDFAQFRTHPGPSDLR